MSFTQLTPQIPVVVETISGDKQPGWAFGVIDYSQDHNLVWVVAMDDGEIWCAPNTKVRVHKNWTMGRGLPLTTAPQSATNQPRTE